MTSSGVGFGTSGARGRVVDMTDAVCFAYTAAFLAVLQPRASGRVALGMDLRPSSPAIASACAAAIRHAGHDPVWCGALPTPALAFHAQEHGLPAIMVTGSHIPFDRNGIKFYRADGEISKADEAAIAAADVALPDDGLSTQLPAVDDTARSEYITRYLDFFPPRALAGMRLGIYEHSSVARDLLGDLLTALGAQVVSLGRTDEFVPIDTEAVAEVDIARGHAWSAEHRLDAILSTDGDADRPLIGDERGNWLRGDIVGLLCARLLGADAVAAPVSCNTAIEACGAFQRVMRTRIGSPYVIEAMQTLATAGGTVAGFEANGGFLLGSALTRDGRSLRPLPTRDAVLPALTLLVGAQRQGMALSALAADLPRRFTASDRLQNFPTADSHALIARLAASTAAIADLLGQQASHIDQTDGLRMTLANGDIVHLRPSGNAPELRCYAEADSPQRAAALASECLSRLR
ncbi:MAG: phosphomannomutase [Pseudomonadales bacterium]|nr:phosphomannomutase [Pseudomonadales bacterium]MCP5183348.1 phosphomannomutase [Pseudomonadales bacterium]